MVKKKAKPEIRCTNNQVVVPLFHVYPDEMSAYLEKAIPDIEGYRSLGWVIKKRHKTHEDLFAVTDCNEGKNINVVIEFYDANHKKNIYPQEAGLVRLTFRCVGCKTKFMKAYANHLLRD